MAVNESMLVGSIAKAVRKAYPRAWTFKVVGSPYQMTGVPDLLFCIDGRLVGVEVKNPRPGETAEHAKTRATPGQLVQIARIKAAGGIAGVTTSVAETLELIEHGLNGEDDGQHDDDLGEGRPAGGR